jgi:hypothetical protein
MSSNDRFSPSQNGQPTDELLAQFHRIEQAWKVAEDKLAATHVPIDVRVKVSDKYIDGSYGNPIGESRIYLGYCKVKGNRRVCIIEECEFFNAHPDEVHEDVKPITECPVDDRLDMFDSFQKLYDEAYAVSKSYVPKIKERVDKFEQSLQWVDI